MNEKQKMQETANWYDKCYILYENCAREMASIIEKVLKKRKIVYQSITYRVKTKKSYLDKSQRDKYKNPIEEIMDLAGIRIIAYTNKDVQAICEVVRQEFCIDEKNSEDKIKKMGENQVGYLSVHYIATMKKSRTNLSEYADYEGVKCEVQIRTLLQHAWAEIEHDKNYKFSGVLPLDIKRRFYLVAGVLEMMDREFDSLSKDIDVYTQETEGRLATNDFEVGIDSVSLEKYMLLKFQNKGLKKSGDVIIIHDEIVNELVRFGFESVNDLDKAFTEEIVSLLLFDAKNETYIGILRNLMMYIDVDQYFEKAYQGGWNSIDNATKIFFENQNINIGFYLNEYNITVDD